MSAYFKSDGRYIYLLKKYCEFYIPMSYFDDTAGFAQDYGATVNAMGIFNVGFLFGDINVRLFADTVIFSIAIYGWGNP